MNFKEIPVGEILPQQPPFVMISHLIHYEPMECDTELEVTSDNIFCDNGCLTEAGIIENVAQTSAARIGYYNKYVVGRDVSVGYIGEVRKFDVLDCPKVGETIRTHIEVMSEAFGLMLVKATVVTTAGCLIAQGEMKVAVKD